MTRTRVLVANRPRLMRDLVLAAIAEQRDIEIVGEIQDEAQISKVVERIRPDVVVVALEESGRLPGECYSLLERFTSLRIVGLAPDREYSLHCWAVVNIQSNRIVVSEQSILTALRSKPQPSGD